MALTPCSHLFGTAEILAAEPDIEHHSDCIYRPFSAGSFLDRDPSWGIYGLNGRLSAAGAYVRGPHRALVGQSRVLVSDVAGIATEHEEHIYFGQMIPHYGHFLVTSLARAWYLSRPDTDNVKLLCHADFPVATMFENSYMGVLVSMLGLSSKNFVRPCVPTRFSRLTIPGPAFLEQKCVHAAYLPAMHRIGDKLLSNARATPSRRAAYLSKSRMGAGSVAHIENEAEIEAALEARGVDIVHPERLTLQAQLQLFASRSKLIGFAGSAFHTHVLLRDPPEITAITLDQFINSNLIMLDRLNRVRSAYYYPSDNIETVVVDGFSVSRRITDVPSFVKDLLDVSGVAEGGLISMHMSNRSTRPTPEGSCVPDHQGESYQTTLQRLHAEMQPRTYLEIGTLTGQTLALSRASSIAIDPRFQITSDVIGGKELCLFYQIESDRFFERFDPQLLLGSPLDLCFLDGMHRCEFLLRDFINAERHASPAGVIALHDCLPVETPMTDRTQCGTPSILPHRGGWWTGDVWRTVAALKRHRPDLRMLCLDAVPTGLVLLSGLDPNSRILAERYDAIVEEMMSMDLDSLTVASFLASVGTTSTASYAAPGALSEALGLARA